MDRPDGLLGLVLFWTGPAQKSIHVPCLGHQASTVAYGGTARWHAGPSALRARAPIRPCLARARAMPG